MQCSVKRLHICQLFSSFSVPLMELDVGESLFKWHERGFCGKICPLRCIDAWFIRSCCGNLGFNHGFWVLNFSVLMSFECEHSSVVMENFHRDFHLRPKLSSFLDTTVFEYEQLWRLKSFQQQQKKKAKAYLTTFLNHFVKKVLLSQFH